MSFWTYKNIYCCFIRHKHETYIQSFIYTSTFFFDLHWGRHVTTRNKHWEHRTRKHTVQLTVFTSASVSASQCSFISVIDVSTIFMFLFVLRNCDTSCRVMNESPARPKSPHQEVLGRMFSRVVNQTRTLRPSWPTNPRVGSNRC